jgi:hypothetical protein
MDIVYEFSFKIIYKYEVFFTAVSND